MHRKLEERGECRRGTRRRIKVRTNGPGANSATGNSGWRFEDKGQVSGLTICLGRVLRHGEGNTNLDSLERVAHAGSAKVDFKVKCNVFKATIQGALLSGLCACAGQSGSFAENELFPAGTMPEYPCTDEEQLGRRAEQAANSDQSAASKAWNVCQLQWNSKSDAWDGAKRVTEQIQKDDLHHQQVLAVIFGQTCLV